MNAKNISMPGTKVKSAEALRQNVRFLVQEFGVERVGFLTLTVGDQVDGRFQPLVDRVEAERRFHRAMQSIRGRYQCGVTVVQRSERNWVHWHLAVVIGADIRSGVDFEAIASGDYRSAPLRLRLEWRWWRGNAERWGLGRHELLPVRHNADALGSYVGRYIAKDWPNRLEQDKGKRSVRYFGHWCKHPPRIDKETGKEIIIKPPHCLRYCACSARAGAWREACRQVQLLTGLHGVELNAENIRAWLGAKWAWRITQKIRGYQFFTHGRRLHPLFKAGLEKHNEEAAGSQHIGNTNLDHWLSVPYDEERELARNCRERVRHNAEMRRRELPTTEELQ